MRILSFDVGTKNLAYCMLSPDGAIEAWEVYGVDPATTRDANALCPEVARTLDERWKTFDAADVVVIERQPGKNRKMKAMEAYIHMYFVVRHKRVVIYSPSKKLEGEDAGMHGKSKYHLRKKTSVVLAEAFLKDDVAARAIFDASKKKDDLADCLMQAIAFSRDDGIKKKTAFPVKARKPTALQEKKQRYTKANIKYLIDAIDTSHIVMIYEDNVPEDELQKRALIHAIERDAPLRKSILRFYSTVRACVDDLKNNQQQQQKQKQDDGDHDRLGKDVCAGENSS